MGDELVSMRRGGQGRERLRAVLITAAVAGGVIAALSLILGGRYGRFINLENFTPHAPDLSHIAAAGWVIQLHLTAALAAFAVGVVLLTGVKGTRLHKTLGWTWVIAMGTTAVASLFIRTLNPGHFSPIHLLSGWTIIALPMAVAAIKRGDIRTHRRFMTGLFTGGLVIAGAFTFLPGRLMWSIFFGHD